MSQSPNHSRRRRIVVLACGLAVLAGAIAGPVSRATAQSDGGINEIGEFHPFGSDSYAQQQIASVIDAARRNWFLVLPDGSASGIGPGTVYQFDPDRLSQVGVPLSLLASSPQSQGAVYALDPDTGLLVLATNKAGVQQLTVVEATPLGPRIVREWPFGAALASQRYQGVNLVPTGMDIVNGKIVVGADTGISFTNAGLNEVTVAEFDLAKLVGGADPFSWRYTVGSCYSLAFFNGTQAAVGRSRRTPMVELPCRTAVSNPAVQTLQGVSVVDLNDGGVNPATFTDSLYPVGGDFSAAQSSFDPVTDRILMRTSGPAFGAVFDGRHRRWLERVDFGVGNMFQTGLDQASGRLYGQGDEVGGGGGGTNPSYLYAPELRPTPPGNGVKVPFSTPTPGSGTFGVIGVDSATSRLFIADSETFDTTNGDRGLFFHIYQDTRPPLPERVAPDADQAVIGLSGEGQGYGARISYVGGVKNSSDNVAGTYPFEQVVAGSSRHATFARTLRLRLAIGDASAEAIETQPEGATDAELTDVGQPWPWDPAQCADFGGSPTSQDAPRGGARVSCDANAALVKDSAEFKNGNDDPYATPILYGKTEATTTIDRVRGVVTSSAAEGSIDLPGLVRIGHVTASAQTWANGQPGGAGSSYERTMDDVSIAGQPFCHIGCDPAAVAAAINQAFAPLESQGVLVVATAPLPDPELLASPGGAQAIIGRDFWDHEQDVAIDEMPVDRFELPAFQIRVYQDRKKPAHQVYSLAGVQAVARVPAGFDFNSVALPATAGGASSFAGSGVLGSTGTGGQHFVPGQRAVAATAGKPGGSGSAVGGALRAGGALLKKIGEALGFGLVSPFSSPGLLMSLGFLGTPVYLASRRRLLMTRRTEVQRA